MGLPRRIDIDLSAGNDIENVTGRYERPLCRTSKQQPESPTPYLAFDEIKTFIRGLFVHSKRNSDVRCFAKCSMLSSIMTFTEVVDTIARWGVSQLHMRKEGAHK